jgi:hypothetical protein
MNCSPLGLAARWQTALESLTARPLLLVAALLLANALVHPYRGLYHDARLYAVGVTERVSPGTFADDLFLRYGSQDRYTLFSPLVAPLVSGIGLEPAFFVVYLLSKALFFWALVRLVLVLIPDRLAALLSLVYLAMALLPYGGNEIIRLNEPFLTPRLLGTALVLLALERALAGRGWQSAGLLVLALVVHPVMVVGGALVLGLWGLFLRLSWRWLAALAVVAVLAGSAVVFHEPWGVAVFGYMPPDWQEVVRQLCFFISPATWSTGDWLRIACAAAVTVAASRLWLRQQAALPAALLLAGALGLAGSAVAACSDYRLLIQTSPYRTLWLLELLAIPFGFAVALWLWRRAGRWGPALGLVVLVLCTADWNQPVPHPLVAFLLVWPVCIIWQRGLKRTPADPDWPVSATVLTFRAGVLLLLALNVQALVVFFRHEPAVGSNAHPVGVLLAAGAVLYKLPLLLLFALGVGLVASYVRFARVAAVLASAAVAWHGGLAWLDDAAWYQSRFNPVARHEQFVQQFVRDRAREMGRRPSVYWRADLRDIWFRAGASSYLNTEQLSGCAFNRGTALEGKRRARLVRCFEAEELRRLPIPWSWWQNALSAFFDVPSAPTPTEEHLFALCADEGLDFVVLSRCFGGLDCANDGAQYIYDCARLRRLAQEVRRRSGHVPRSACLSGQGPPAIRQGAVAVGVLPGRGAAGGTAGARQAGPGVEPTGNARVSPSR